jgi:septum site-determining protein MinD
MDTAGLPLLGIVPEDKDVTVAASQGVPLVLYSHKRAAMAYLNISKRLTGSRVPLMKIR